MLVVFRAVRGVRAAFAHHTPPPLLFSVGRPAVVRLPSGHDGLGGRAAALGAESGQRRLRSTWQKREVRVPTGQEPPSFAFAFE